VDRRPPPSATLANNWKSSIAVMGLYNFSGMSVVFGLSTDWQGRYEVCLLTLAFVATVIPFWCSYRNK
jgi:hypothetical protein